MTSSNLHIRLLGTAAGGGLPQWNCACTGCLAVRRGELAPNGQFSMALSIDGENWLLVNASPDLRQQLNECPSLHPRALRHSPIKAVVLTNGEIDAVAGLLTLREGQAFDLWADETVHKTLAANSIFNVLRQVDRKIMPRSQEFEPLLGLKMQAFIVLGKPAWYLEGEQSADAGDTIGLEIWGAGKRILIIPACATFGPDLQRKAHGADALFLDGTLWHDDEMIEAGLAPKRGRDMGHHSISGPDGALALTQGLKIKNKIFIHINNSNPVLLPQTPERRAVEAAGWSVGWAGQELTL